MKKLIVYFMAVSILFSLVACARPQDSNESPQASENTENNAGIQVDEGLFTVEITMPATFFNDKTEEEIIATSEENGFISCTINEDGSVTYTMTRAKHKQMLDEFKMNLDETIDELINGENKVASFVAIDYNDDYSQVDIYVDPNTYAMWDNLYALTFYLTGAYYQAFSGVAAEEIDVTVNFIDNETKEILNTASYKDYMANANNTEE